MSRYVYVTHSRRAGGASLGIDLTPSKACSLACIYCQIPREARSRERSAVDVAELGRDLAGALASPPEGGYADLAVAGSGEPTLAQGLGEALAEIARVCKAAGFEHPRRLYTNGLHLGSPRTSETLSAFVRGKGEVWVKLDGAAATTLDRVWRTRLSPGSHLSHVWDFARFRPIGIQSMLMRAPGLPPPEVVAREIGAALSWGLERGARIGRLHLVAPSRPPGDSVVAAGLVPATAEELSAAAAIINRMVPIPIDVFV